MTRWIQCTWLVTMAACASTVPPARSAGDEEIEAPAAPAADEPEPRVESAPSRPDPEEPMDEAATAAALGVAPEALFAAVRVGTETWGVVRAREALDPSLEALAQRIEGRCSTQNLACAVSVAGRRERACAALGCESWQLRVNRGPMSTTPLTLSPQLLGLETRTAPTLDIRDVDGDGRLEAMATFGAQLENVDGLWTVRIVRIVDLGTGATQGVFIRRTEHDVFADEGQPAQYHVTDQTWRLEGTDLHLHRVVGEGMCDSGDGPPEASDDVFDECLVTTLDRRCAYRPATDDYECHGGVARPGPLTLPRWLADELLWR